MDAMNFWVWEPPHIPIHVATKFGDRWGGPRAGLFAGLHDVPGGERMAGDGRVGPARNC